MATKKTSATDYNKARDYTDSTWRHVQIAVGVKPTGKPTASLTKAVKAFQTDNDLEADGKIGPLTLKAIGATPKASGDKFLPNLVAEHDDRIYGIDVSDYQGRPNFDHVFLAGARFCIIKLSEGRTWRSKYAVDNWSKAVESGLVVAGYHLARLIDKGRESDVEGALDNFLGYLGKVGATFVGIPHMLDLEYKQVKYHVDQYGTKNSLAWIERFVAGYYRRTGYECGLYLAPRTMRLLGKSYGDLPKLVAWIADYGEIDPLPKNWTRRDYRQFTSSGIVPGVKGKCDLNYTKGDL